MTREDIKTINDIVHKTIYGFFDVCSDEEETPMTDKDKLLLEVNKAVCNNIKDLEQEPCEDAISRRAAIEKIHWLGLDNDTTIKCDLAIRALPFVNPQEPCEDAISRQAALDGLASIAKAKAKSDAQKSLMGRVMFFTERLPSVKPQEPQSGYWQKHTDASGNSWHTCPACGHIAYTLTRFCPDCGERLEAPS